MSQRSFITKSMLPKNIVKSLIIEHLKGTRIKDLSKVFNREKVRKSLIYHYPYIYKNKNNPKLLKMILTKKASGCFTYTDRKGMKYIFDKKYKLLIERLNPANNGNNYLQFQYKRKTFYIHRLIAGAKKGEEVDHIDRDKFDNRELNLRISNRSQNAANKKSNGYFEITERKLSKPFRVRLKIEFIGYYETKEEAQKAYREAHIKKYGKFSPYKDL